MPKQKSASTRKAKGKAEGKKKKGASSSLPHSLALESNASHRPKCPKARSLCLHVLRQRAARERERRKPWHRLRSVASRACTILASDTLFFIGQVGKVLGERWKALSTSQREPYEAKARADKERYDAEKASYNVSYSSTDTTSQPMR